MVLRVFVLILLSVTLGNSERCELDEACDISDGNFGVAKRNTDCKSYLKLDRQTQRSVRNCGFSGAVPLICCPGEISPNFSRKAIEQCKKFGKRPEDRTGDRVMFGKNAELGEFPHFASLGYTTDNEDVFAFVCGGALISENFVLTAAHCCKQSRQPKIIRLGKTAANMGDTDDHYSPEDVRVQQVIRHPNYLESQKYFDIALVKLLTSVKFSINIWPACLYPQYDLHGKVLAIAGFGRNNPINSNKLPIWLQKASAQETPLDDCRKDYKDTYGDVKIMGIDKGITDNMLCAKDNVNGADTCGGDSGSGIFLLAPNATFYVVGVTSFGVSCTTTLPSFYSRVYSYLDWIEENVWK